METKDGKKNAEDITKLIQVHVIQDLACLIVEYARYTEKQTRVLSQVEAQIHYCLSLEEVASLRPLFLANKVWVQIFDVEQKAIEVHGKLHRQASEKQWEKTWRSRPASAFGFMK